MVGLPYSGEISVAQHDGTPVPDEPLSLCVSLYGDIRKFRDVLSYYYGFDEEELFDAGQKITQLRQSVVCQNVSTSNPGGKIRFYVPLMRETISAEVKKMIIRVTAINYPSNNPTGMIQPTR